MRHLLSETVGAAGILLLPLVAAGAWLYHAATFRARLATCTNNLGRRAHLSLNGLLQAEVLVLPLVGAAILLCRLSELGQVFFGLFWLSFLSHIVLLPPLRWLRLNALDWFWWLAALMAHGMALGFTLD